MHPHRTAAWLAVAALASLPVFAPARPSLDGPAADAADRDDPGWRLADLLARRQRPTEDRNSALRVKAALAKLPADWLTETHAQRQGDGPPRGLGLYESISNLAPQVRLSDAQAASLRDELAPLADALAEARRLADLPEGFFVDFKPSRNYYETPLTHIQDARRIARLLQLDAALRAHRGDADGALDSVRAILGLARSIGDEPTMMSQLVRMAFDAVAVTTLDRVLAQSLPGEPALARLQDALTDEADEPLALHALRGERAGTFEIYEALIRGDISLRDLAESSDLKNPEALERQARRPGPGGMSFYRYNQNLTLDYLNQAVEIAKRPGPEQLPLLDALAAEIAAGSKQPAARLTGSLTYLLVPSINTGARAFIRNRAVLETARAMAACERFRLAAGRWPNSADELVPRFLDAVPIDPYLGRPVRLKPVEGGLIVHGAGIDGVDHGGQLDPKGRALAGFDLGRRLLDPDQRPGAVR